MTNQAPENTQFFLTAPMPCPYLPGREERKLFTHLSGRRAGALHHLLSDSGFRRSQNLIYRPACEGCAACRSVRIVAAEFDYRARFRRILKTNADIRATVMPARSSPEHYNLFRRYLERRHTGGGMTQMSYVDFEYMVEDTPVQTMLVEYRVVRTRQLVGVALTDVLPDGLSMVYSFFDPEMASRSLGTYVILDHVKRAHDTTLGYVYLGFWVKDSPKMAYKAQFAPLEVQNGSLGWCRVEGPSGG
jgi:arginyl-tRNA--protein-N-Asp/Glu arginylyltransferase